MVPVAHHSGAAHVTIQLAWDGAQVRLTITDDGTGFDVAHVNGRGVGLASMRERMDSLSGELILDSRPGAGTRVTVSVPLKGGAGGSRRGLLAPAAR